MLAVRRTVSGVWLGQVSHQWEGMGGRDGEHRYKGALLKAPTSKAEL